MYEQYKEGNIWGIRLKISFKMPNIPIIFEEMEGYNLLSYFYLYYYIYIYISISWQCAAKNQELINCY